MSKARQVKKMFMSPRENESLKRIAWDVYYKREKKARHELAETLRAIKTLNTIYSNEV